MQPLSQRNSPMERFLPANFKLGSVLVLLIVLLISACQKKMDVINDQFPLSQKRIEVAEIKQWVDRILPTLVDQPTLLYARAEQSTINGNHFVRIPTKGKGSDKGSFYFKRRPDGSMEVNYVVQLVSDSIKGNGIVGFANLDEKSFRVNVYENNKLVLSKIVPDSLGLFNKAFLSSAPQIKKLSGCPEEVTRITLPDGSDSVIIVKTLGDPRIDCPRPHGYESFWDRVQTFFGNIGRWFSNNFGGGGGGGNSGGGDPWGLWFFAWNGVNIGGNGNGHSGSGGSGDFSGGGGGGGGQNGSLNPWGPFQFPPFHVTGNNISKTPCDSLKDLASKASEVFLKSQANIKLESIPNLASEKKEKGFPILHKFSINPTNKYDTTFTSMYSGNIETGTDSTFVFNGSVGRLEVLVALLHTHPPIGYSAPSPYDFFAMINEASKNPYFTHSFIASSNGDIYAITISNYSKAISFMPKLEQSLQGSTFNDDDPLGKAFESAKIQFIKEGLNRDLVYERALSVVFNDFDAGLTLNKRGPDGNFSPVSYKSIPDPKRPKKKIIIEDCK